MSSQSINRRSFLAAGAAGAVSGPALGAAAASAGGMATPGAARGAGAWGGQPEHAVSISSANGLGAVARAVELINSGMDPVEGIVQGVRIVEDDPNDSSVGYGGLPNEDGVVQLDSSVMHGPTHKAGAVACIENIRNPASVALEVLRRTDHVLLVGEGAKRFALRMGFTEENLLTDRAREAWLRWRRNLHPGDDWLDDDQLVPIGSPEQFRGRRGGRGRGGAGGRGADGGGDNVRGPLSWGEHVELIEGIPHTWGTIHCSAVNTNGDVSACTTTSGLSWKLPGRVGDSPIIGAGMFVDNEIGAAGATGRGESVIQSCGAFQIVRHMADGLSPTDACLKALQYIADHTKRPDLLNERGEPNFGCVYYALRKDGAYGSATMRGGGRFSVCDENGPRHEDCAVLFE